MSVSKNTCQYEGCDRRINAPHSQTYCLFHAPAEEKGVDEEIFKQKLLEQIRTGDLNFEGFVFPHSIDFFELLKDINISNVIQDKKKFLEIKIFVNFKNTKFLGNEILILNINFTKGLTFNNAQFSEKTNIYIKNTQFLGETYFNDTKFSGPITFFNNTKFEGETYFEYTEFSGVETYIQNVQFSGETYFKKIIFSGFITINAQFEGETYFINNHLNNARLKFKQLKFIKDATIKFSGINIHDKNTANFNSVIYFSETQFLPFQTFFENMQNDNFKYPLFVFRACNLKDVYFTNNNMGLFSFHQSTFEHARFISCTWPTRNGRSNILPEEILLEEILHEPEQSKNLISRYDLQNLTSYLEISSLYRRMKTALDNLKDFPEAGKFYYNEFEMRRKHYWYLFKKKFHSSETANYDPGNTPPNAFLNGIFAGLYWLYKITTGYGEKAGRSFWGFILTLLLTTTALMFTGYCNFQGEWIDYRWACQWPDGGAITDFLKTVLHTLILIFPRGWMFSTSPHPLPTHQVLIQFLAFVLLIYFITFFFIALRRHFRRF